MLNNASTWSGAVNSSVRAKAKLRYKIDIVMKIRVCAHELIQRVGNNWGGLNEWRKGSYAHLFSFCPLHTNGLLTLFSWSRSDLSDERGTVGDVASLRWPGLGRLAGQRTDLTAVSTAEVPAEHFASSDRTRFRPWCMCGEVAHLLSKGDVSSLGGSGQDLARRGPTSVSAGADRRRQLYSLGSGSRNFNCCLRFLAPTAPQKVFCQFVCRGWGARASGRVRCWSQHGSALGSNPASAWTNESQLGRHRFALNTNSKELVHRRIWPAWVSHTLRRVNFRCGSHPKIWSWSYTLVLTLLVANAVKHLGNAVNWSSPPLS